jgi:hypothetical protein
MQFTVECFYDDGEGSEGSAWSGLGQPEAWAQFGDLVNARTSVRELVAFSDPTWRVFIFRRAEVGCNRSVVAQAWVDQHSEVQVRVSRGYAPMCDLGRFATV